MIHPGDRKAIASQRESFRAKAAGPIESLLSVLRGKTAAAPKGAKGGGQKLGHQRMRRAGQRQRADGAGGMIPKLIGGGGQKAQRRLGASQKNRASDFGRAQVRLMGAAERRGIQSAQLAKLRDQSGGRIAAAKKGLLKGAPFGGGVGPVDGGAELQKSARGAKPRLGGHRLPKGGFKRRKAVSVREIQIRAMARQESQAFGIPMKGGLLRGGAKMKRAVGIGAGGQKSASQRRGAPRPQGARFDQGRVKPANASAPAKKRSARGASGGETLKHPKPKGRLQERLARADRESKRKRKASPRARRIARKDRDQKGMR